MGDRGQVYIKDNKVYLYTHSGASELLAKVEAAIAKKWRWDDPDYLTRIIFDEMTEGQHCNEMGYGIGTEWQGDVWRLIVVDCEKQTVEDKHRVNDAWVIKTKESFGKIAENKVK